MGFMEILPWVIVVILLAVVAFLVTRKPTPDAAPADRGGPAGERRAPSDAGGRAGLPDAPTESPADAGPAGDPSGSAPDSRARVERERTVVVLNQVLSYLERSPLALLREAEERFDLPAPAADALDALEDLAFYGSLPSADADRENLSHLVQEVTREYSRDHEVPVRVVGPERPVVFEVASEWFKDVLYLLLANAHRFGDGEGIEVRLSGGQAVPALVEVRDFGGGFDPEGLAHAFEPFWTTDPEATGLGLFHCRMLVDRMGGEIEIGNHPEGGGRVRVLLPAAPPSQEAGSRRVGPAA